MRPSLTLVPLFAAVAQLLACANEPGPVDASEPPETSGEDSTGDSTGDTGDGEPAPFAPPIGDDTSITPFDDAHVWFGEENHREIDVAVELPAAELAYESVTLTITLGCPNDKCDWWDRKGFLGLVRDPGTEQESIVEIARFMTPYRVGAVHVIDVTELRPLLAGDVVMRVFIDTWVGPGHQNGDGWLFDAQFDFVGGAPTRMPIAAIPLWDYQTVEYGNPALPIAEAVAPVAVEIPAEADAVELRSIITGHGQGNLDNCAEFCPRNHGFLVGEQAFVREIWRDNCAETPVQGQQGTWQYPRAGWCPGAEVIPWVEAVGDAVVPGSTVSVTYDVESYENTCRPDSPNCSGCSLGTGCEYDGGSHTPPIYDISAMLIAYRTLGEA